MPAALKPAQIRRKAFAEYIAQGKNGTEAAKLAGFTGTQHALEVTASRLLRHAEVQELITTAAEKASKRRVLTAEERRELLTLWATQAEEPAELRDRIAALKELNAMDGLHLKKIEVSGPGGGPIQQLIAELPTDVIRKRIEELKARKP